MTSHIFGQIPDTRYFRKAFEPILVTGDDGNKYNLSKGVIAWHSLISRIQIFTI